MRYNKFLRYRQLSFCEKYVNATLLYLELQQFCIENLLYLGKKISAQNCLYLVFKLLYFHIYPFFLVVFNRKQLKLAGKFLKLDIF